MGVGGEKELVRVGSVMDGFVGGGDQKEPSLSGMAPSDRAEPTYSSSRLACSSFSHQISPEHNLEPSSIFEFPLRISISQPCLQHCHSSLSASL